MKIRKWDIVQVLSGKDKGTKGKVLRAMPKKEMVVVEWVHVVTRNLPKQGGNPGRQMQFEKPIHVSRVGYFCEETKKPTRIGFKMEKNKKIRFKKSTGKVI